MLEIWLYSLVSVIAISLVSLIGVIFLAIQLKKLKHFLLYLVAFAAGALLGDSFIHLLPELLETTALYTQISLYILLGITIFFILEKVIFWRHCHLPTTETHPHPVGLINLVGDAFHNFLDGVIITGSFLVDVKLGLATSIAVFLHEIPQEIGDFSILIHAGYTRARALFFNFLSALAAILGTVVILVAQSAIENLTLFLIPFTIGGFIYIATADLIPAIHRETHSMRSIVQLFYFVLGIGIMVLLK